MSFVYAVINNARSRVLVAGHSVELPAARTPRTVWVELTSKCPLDCVFCSRKMRRGAGEHLPFGLYEELIRDLSDPRRVLLNYSGESTGYPKLIPAIQLARAAGAYVELVTAMVSAPEWLLKPLSRSGLNRLTVSVHAVGAATYSEVYRYGSFDMLRARLEQFVSLCRGAPHPPQIDLAFVAMDRNLAELPAVAAFGRSLGISEIYIFPVIRRDEIPATFPGELTILGQHRPEFEERVRRAAESVRESQPDAQLIICNPRFNESERCLGEIPRPFPWMLPAGAAIHSCEQNPWETAHVLANGDVVACEVLDKKPLGNLFEQSIAEIWAGEAYRRFRMEYHGGRVAECRVCPWKRAYVPGPPAAEILAKRGRAAQLLHGWHDPADELHVWSSQQAAAVVAPRPGARRLHVHGILPPGPGEDANELTISCNGAEVGRVANPSRAAAGFELDLPVEDASQTWGIEFRTRFVYRPIERGTGADQRDLGFALLLLASKRRTERAVAQRREGALQPLVRAIGSIDRVGVRLRERFGPRRLGQRAVSKSAGISVVIPERDNARELAGCLQSLRSALADFPEPAEMIVVVNGSPVADYRALQREHGPRWIFHEAPLGFSQAVLEGLRHARFDWVYLLNNDVELDRHAFTALAPYRQDGIFAIGSQVFLKDRTVFRDETNWGALLIEDGLATIHDWIPRSDRVVESFYTGGGASLFQTRLLRRLLDASVYAPFYWEDVEWGWRARKLGYRSLLCPGSVAWHRRQATISRCYTPAEVEATTERNQLLFQLRNFTTVGSLKRVMDTIAAAQETVAATFLRRRAVWEIGRGRIWNHLAPLTDEQVLAAWDRAVSSS